MSWRPQLAHDPSVIGGPSGCGNIATTEIIASIEYGAAVLGIKLIMVLGHRNCGAVQAAIDGKAVPGQISSLYRFLRPAVNAAGNDLRAATEANTTNSSPSSYGNPHRCSPS